MFTIMNEDGYELCQMKELFWRPVGHWFCLEEALAISAHLQQKVFIHKVTS